MAITPDILLLGNSRGDILLTLPNSGALIGIPFYMQRLDLSLMERRGTACATTYRPTAFAGVSNGINGVIGI